MPGAPARLEVTSSLFYDGGQLPKAMLHTSVGGLNQSPPLAWKGEPPSTRGFAVLCWDRDAPTGVGFFHWVLFNLPPDVHEIAPNSGVPGGKLLPGQAVLGMTDLGQSAYGGPCPPPGLPHHYEFTVHALDVARLDGGPNSTGAALRFAMHGHVLAEGKITGVYGR